jgi:hypothetical protein
MGLVLGASFQFFDLWLFVVFKPSIPRVGCFGLWRLPCCNAINQKAEIFYFLSISTLFYSAIRSVCKSTTFAGVIVGFCVQYPF